MLCAGVAKTRRQLFWVQGERDNAFEHLGRAREMVETREASRAKAFVTSSLSRFLMLASEDAEAIRLGREALGMAELLGLDELRASTLNNIGVSRMQSGDLGGLRDLDESIAVGTRANAPTEVARAQLNLASVLWDQGELARSTALIDECSAVTARFGLAGFDRWIRGESVLPTYTLGRWAEALAGADEFLAEVEAGSLVAVVLARETPVSRCQPSSGPF